MSRKYLKYKKKKPYIVTSIVLVVLALAFAAVGILAKYRAEQLRQAELISAGFHLSSDYLTVEGKEYTIPNTAPIEITLYNYETENISLISQVDIEYVVTVDGGTCATSEGTLTAGEKIEKTLIITPHADAKEVTVTVAAKKPFAYTLKATFKLSDLAATTCESQRITDNGDYYLVTIHTGQRSGQMTLSWTDGLIPDKTNALMRDWTGSPGKLQVDSYSTYELIFFNPNGIDNATFNLS